MSILSTAMSQGRKVGDGASYVVVEQLTTNSSGQTEQVQLPAPPVEYSLEPSIIQPYSEYNLMVEAEALSLWPYPEPKYWPRPRPYSRRP